MIAVIDYGMGNLRSVQKALEEAGAKAKITSGASDIRRCDKVVFPGVGAFGDAVKELKRRGLIGPIKEAIAGGKPFLGLCLGLQLLFEKSEEAPGVKGLGVLKGEVKRFSGSSLVASGSKDRLKVPHMGWNEIKVKSKKSKVKSDILKGIPDGSYFYFVHSYYAKPRDPRIVLTTTNYGIDFVSAVRKDNVYGLQFHPEKSQAQGLKILRNFIGLK
jgi:glutamine amidotransferase